MHSDNVLVGSIGTEPDDITSYIVARLEVTAIAVSPTGSSAPGGIASGVSNLGMGDNSSTLTNLEAVEVKENATRRVASVPASLAWSDWTEDEGLHQAYQQPFSCWRSGAPLSNRVYASGQIR